MFLLLTTNKAAMTSCVNQQFKTWYPFFSILTGLSHGQSQIKHFFRGKNKRDLDLDYLHCLFAKRASHSFNFDHMVI